MERDEKSNWSTPFVWKNSRRVEIVTSGSRKVRSYGLDGDTFVIQAGPEFKVLHSNSVGELCLATPAISRGSLILRTESQLLRIGKR